MRVIVHGNSEPQGKAPCPHSDASYGVFLGFGFNSEFVDFEKCFLGQQFL
jgi:hypothetical protein